jgi:hypothetical protein
MHTLNDDLRIKINLGVNAEDKGLPAARYTPQRMWKHCIKAQESAGALEWGKYNHFWKAYVLDVDIWTWRNSHDAIDSYNQC